MKRAFWWSFTVGWLLLIAGIWVPVLSWVALVVGFGGVVWVIVEFFRETGPALMETPEAQVFWWHIRRAVEESRGRYSVR